jgi:hypothetical protein
MYEQPCSRCQCWTNECFLERDHDGERVCPECVALDCETAFTDDVDDDREAFPEPHCSCHSYCRSCTPGVVP